MFVAQKKHIVFLNMIITAILIAVGLLAVLYTVFLRGTARTHIFVEVINISTAKSIWAYFTTCAVHPSQSPVTPKLAICP